MGYWLRIIETIINYIPYIKSGTEMPDEYYLVRRVLVDNIPKYWSGDF